jgi:hypothetical protein
VEDAAEVRVDDGSPVVVRHPRQDAVARQPRVVDEDVDVARLLDERSRLIRVRDVRLQSAPADLRRDRLGFLYPRAIADDDRRSRLAELDGNRAADSSRAPGDEGCPSLEGAELRRQ